MNISFISLIFVVKVFLFLSLNLKASYIFVSNENSDTVTILDAKEKKVIKTISTGGRPRDLKISKDNNFLYIVESEENQISILDISILEIIGSIKTGDDPEIFDIHPTKNLLAVSNEDDNELTLIDIEKKKIIKTIKNVGVEPEGVNFSPDGKYIYVTSEGTNSILIINNEKKEVENEILVGNRPRRGLFVSKHGEYWVSNELSGSVTIINTETQSIKKNIKFKIKGIQEQDISPVDFAHSTKRNKVFVTLGNANHVAVVDASNYQIEKYILVGSRVWGAAITKDDKELIVTNGNSDDITIINLDKMLAIKSIPVGTTPHSVRVSK